MQQVIQLTLSREQAKLLLGALGCAENARVVQVAGEGANFNFALMVEGTRALTEAVSLYRELGSPQDALGLLHMFRKAGLNLYDAVPPRSREDGDK